MKTIVISLGGSAIVPDSIHFSFLKEFKNIILGLKDKRIVIVCGGGSTARNYIEGVKKISEVDHNEQDWIGIYATRINAMLVKAMFGNKVYDEILSNPETEIKTDKKILIGAGWKPGFSTDMGGVLLAKKFGADEVINISNIDHVYDKDPKKFPDAIKMDKVNWEKFIRIVGNKWVPGMNVPFDPIASKKAMELGLKVKILNMDTKNISKCLKGKKFIGTVIG